MARYKITAPDGHQYYVTAPEGATQEQVMAYAQSQYKSASKQPDFSGINASMGKPYQDKAATQQRVRAQNAQRARARALDNPLNRAVENAGKRYDKWRKDNPNMVMDFVDSTLTHAGNAVVGADQLLRNGDAWLADKVAPNSQYAANMRAEANATNANAKQREADYQARTRNNVASGAGFIAGEAVPVLLGGGALRAAGNLPKAAKALEKLPGWVTKPTALAAQGGGTAAVAPVVGDGDYAGNKLTQIAVGAAAAPTIVGGGKLAGMALKGGRNVARLATDKGRTKLAEDRLLKLIPEDSRAGLNQSGQVPGTTLTVAQANPSAENLKLERALRNNPASSNAFIDATGANNAAIRNEVASIAGTEAEMAAARAARRDSPGQFFADNLPQGESAAANIDASPILAEITTLTKHTNKTVRDAANELLGNLRNNMDEAGMVQAGVLDGMRQNLRATLAKVSQNGKVNSQEAVQLDPLKNKIVSTIEGTVPGYRDSVADYARLSQPITDMEAGGRLLRTIDDAGLDSLGNQNVTLPTIRTAIARDDRSEFGLSDAARDRFDNIMRFKQRQSISNNPTGAFGPGTASDLQLNILDNPWLRFAGRAGGTLAGGGGGFMLGGPLGMLAGSTIGGALADVANAGNRAVLGKVGERMANSQMAADALENALRRQQPNKLLQFANQYLLPYNP